MNEIESAIEYLAPITEHPTMTGEYCKNLKVAVTALREKAEREKGCEYCNSRFGIASHHVNQAGMQAGTKQNIGAANSGIGRRYRRMRRHSHDQP